MSDYQPYLEEATKRGTVKSKRTSIGVVGASGTGKTSILRLLLNQPPVYQHDSTPVARPLKGTWMISLGDKRWIQAAPDTLHAAIANSVKDMKKNQQHREQSPSNHEEIFSKSPIRKKRKIDPTDMPSPPSQTSESSQSTSPLQANHVSILDLPAVKLVAEILDSGKDLEGFHFVNIVDSGGQASFIDIGSSTNILNKIPELNEVYQLLEDKSVDWDRIGRKLGVPRNDRVGLQRDQSLTNDQRLETVLDLWLQQGGDSSTWDQLMKSLEELNYNDVVRKIRTF